MTARQPPTSQSSPQTRPDRLVLPFKTQHLTFLTQDLAQRSSLTRRPSVASGAPAMRRSTNLFSQAHLKPTLRKAPDSPLQRRDFKTSLYPPTAPSRKWLRDTAHLKHIRIGLPQRTHSSLPTNLGDNRILHSKSGFSIKFTPKPLPVSESRQQLSSKTPRLADASVEVTLQAKTGWKLQSAIDAIDGKASRDSPGQGRRFDLAGLKAHIRKKLKLSEKTRGGLLAVSLSALKRSDPQGFAQQRASAAMEASLDGSKLIVLPKKPDPVDPEDSPENRHLQALLREKYQSAAVDSSVVLRLHQIRLTDAAFLKTTKPNKDHYDSLKRRNHTRVLDAPSLIAIEDSGREFFERMATKSYGNIEDLPNSQYLVPMAKTVTAWLRQPPTHQAKPTDKQIAVAVSNLFAMVHRHIKRPESQSSEREKSLFLESFFEACDALILKELEAEGLKKGQVASSRLGAVCQAMNALVYSMKSDFHLVTPQYLTNMVKGYLQNLFLVFFDLTDAQPASWNRRLRSVGIGQLSIVQNLDALFTVHSFSNYFVVDDSFFPFFDRFYTCVLSLILKAEAIAEADDEVWKFLFDLYALHFTFMKTVICNLYCRNVMSQLTEEVVPENILLRFLATLESVPPGKLQQLEVFDALESALLQMAKMFENRSLYQRTLQTHMTSQLLTSMFGKLDSMLASRFSKNSKEQLPILSVTRDLCRSVTAFVVGCEESPVYSHTRKWAVDHLNLLMMSLQRKKVASRLVGVLHETYSFILEAAARGKQRVD